VLSFRSFFIDIKDMGHIKTALITGIVLFVVFSLHQYYLYSFEAALSNELVMASSNNDLDKVIELAKHGARLDFLAVKRINGRYRSTTALIQAAGAGHKEMIGLIIQLGASPNYADFDGQTPLHIAAGEGRVEVMEALISAGASLGAKNSLSQAILHQAAAFGKVNTVAFLLDRGADIDQQDRQGFTPLSFAVQEDHLEVVKLLVERGASTAVPNSQGETPYSIATKLRHKSIERFLQSKGAGSSPIATDKKTDLDTCPDNEL
jgi:ankyrin repeat protein